MFTSCWFAWWKTISLTVSVQNWKPIFNQELTRLCVAVLGALYVFQPSSNTLPPAAQSSHPHLTSLRPAESLLKCQRWRRLWQLNKVLWPNSRGGSSLRRVSKGTSTTVTANRRPHQQLAFLYLQVNVLVPDSSTLRDFLDILGLLKSFGFSWS